MKPKAQADPNRTYILDEDEIGELDEQSLTVVLGELEDSLAATDCSAVDELSESSRLEYAADSGLFDRVDDLESAEEVIDAPSEDLLAPEVLFPAGLDEEDEVA